MSRTAPMFRQADLTRAIKSALAAGVAVARVEIDPTGKIVIVAACAARAETLSDFDRWKASRHADPA